MELQEQVNALEAQNKQYISIIEGMKCEILAFDKAYVSSIKEVISLSKELFLKGMIIENFNKQIQDLLNSKEELKSLNDKLTDELNSLKSSAG